MPTYPVRSSKQIAQPKTKHRSAKAAHAEWLKMVHDDEKRMQRIRKQMGIKG